MPSLIAKTSTAAVLTVLAAAGLAHADDASVSLSASASGGVDADAASSSAPASEAEDQGPPWGVEAGTWEMGLYWGLFLPDGKHELFEAKLSTITLQELEDVTPELGLRGGYYPVRLLGLELEAGLLPSQTKLTGDGVNLYTLRGQLVLLAPTKAIVPFLLAGGGLLGIASDDDVLGSDLDGAVHVGVGAKAFITPELALRVDVRDNITSAVGDGELAQHWEVLVGLSVVSGREEPPPPPPPDTDGDGIIDANDKCPEVVGMAPEGCPPPDTDGDGIVDADDKCPTEAGVASVEPDKHGCPPPPPDGDGDGVPDASDACPTVAGDGPDGCLQDGDGDGIVNRDDKCASEPETKNGYEDEDGCPDDLPQEIKAFTGTIEGIVFDANQASIRAISFAKLNQAAQVLAQYPNLRVEISGHTDSSGKAERNLELSAQRAEAVKSYLVSRGIAEDRIVTRGAGDTQPVADNKTKEGRARNRRIEFTLLQDQAASEAPPAPPATGEPAPPAPAPAPAPPAPAQP